MNKLLLIFALILNCYSFKIFSQDDNDYTWWNEKHNWDGITPWSSMIKRLPGIMGPNALPIPEIRDVKIGDKVNLYSSINFHKGRGEIALNPYLNLEIPISKNKIAIDLTYRPFEMYKTEDFIRDERIARKRSAKGITTGDLYIGTIIQLFKPDKYPINANLRLTIKTTSGKDFANARHIDAPAYHFDVNIGKEFEFKNSKIKKIYFHSMFGLYVWQMQYGLNMQNDAFLFGIRTDFVFNKFEYSNSFASYTGYLGYYDQPIALRNSLILPLSKMKIYFTHSYGIRDHIKQTFSIGTSFNFNK